MSSRRSARPPGACATLVLALVPAGAPRRRVPVAARPPRVRDHARERELRRDLRRSVRRLRTSPARCPKQGALLERLLRHRPREQRQLHLDRLRPAAQPAEPGRLPDLRRLHRRGPRCRAGSSPAPAACTRPTSRTSAPSCRRAGLNWKAYEEDMGNDPNRETAACGHPALNSQDKTQSAEAGDGYATRHDPFVYFHSVIDDQTLLRRARRRARVADGRDARRRARRRDGPGHRPEEDLDHAGVLVHHPEPVRRRPRLPVHEPAERRLGARGHRHLPANVGAADHELAGVQEERAARDHVRRVRRATVGCLVMLRRAARGRGLAAARGSPGRAAGWSAPCCCRRSSRRAPSSTTPYNHYSSLASWETLFGLPRLADAASVPATFGVGRVHGFDGLIGEAP